jgi:hypothetical protein
MRTLRRVALWEFQCRFCKLSPVSIAWVGVAFWMECVLAKFPNIEVLTLLYGKYSPIALGFSVFQTQVAEHIAALKKKQLAKNQYVRYPEVRFSLDTDFPHALRMPYDEPYPNAFY